MSITTASGGVASSGRSSSSSLRPADAVVMDMTYKPLETPFLARARGLQRPTVDGLEMLIRQAAPSFEAFFGRVPAKSVDVRALCIEALGAAA